jgi:outer membrane receptor protein involved in Fe transport
VRRSRSSLPIIACFSLRALGQAEQHAAGAPEESVLFQELPTVEAASLHAQTLREAPASVTVITDQEIRRYGYRTLGEALAGVRGFYVSQDRAYHYAGLRGFSLPGDYNTRFLVMLNGHYLTENIYQSNGFFGQDFGLDLDLVKRIEIIRGPSSALYGSNGIFATINIVTKSPVEQERARVSTETGSFGEKKLQVSSATDLGGGANLLVSASVFQNSGQPLYFPEFDAVETNRGRAASALANTVQDNRDLSLGDWLGSRLSCDWTVPGMGVLTIGGEINADARALQRNFDVSPAARRYLEVDVPDISYGVFVQQQWELSNSWTAYFGARLDDARNHDRFVSPRIALIYRRRRRAYKILYGRSFRNPSAYEQFYSDGAVTQIANPFLRPEKVHTLEFVAERSLRRNLDFVATAYHYRLANLIDTGDTAKQLLQYRNMARTQATGLEAELRGRALGRLETAASVAVQSTVKSHSGRPLTNSPSRVGKLRAGIPLAKDKLFLGAALQYVSARKTLANSSVPAVYLPDVTVTCIRVAAGLDLQFGIRNLLDQRYWDPAGAGQALDRIAADGRAAYVKVIWRTGE